VRSVFALIEAVNCDNDKINVYVIKSRLKIRKKDRKIWKSKNYFYTNLHNIKDGSGTAFTACEVELI